MCTTVWGHTREGYRLVFNRDEKRSRPDALPPALYRSGSASWLMPLDPQGGGSWIAVNDSGVCVALLNDYASPFERGFAERRSRGHVVRQLVSRNDWHTLPNTLSEDFLTGVPPFFLLVIRPEGHRIHNWNGSTLRPVPPERSHSGLMTSSSWNPSEVVQERQRAFARHLGQQQEAIAFCDLLEADRSAFSPCMERPDARTVSQTTVEVSRLAIRMGYAQRKAFYRVNTGDKRLLTGNFEPVMWFNF